MTVIVVSPDELKTLIKSAISEYEAERVSKEPEKLYTINKASEILGLSHATVKKMVTSGQLKSTADGKVLSSSINDYLKCK